MRGGRSTTRSVFDDVDQWLDRLQLVDEGDDEVASFLDTLDLRGPQEREMLTELARKAPLAGHRRALAALSSPVGGGWAHRRLQAP
jgi:hypothetical protein